MVLLDVVLIPKNYSYIDCEFGAKRGGTLTDELKLEPLKKRKI